MNDNNETITLILLVGIRHSMCECDLLSTYLSAIFTRPYVALYFKAVNPTWPQCTLYAVFVKLK